MIERASNARLGCCAKRASTEVLGTRTGWQCCTAHPMSPSHFLKTGAGSPLPAPLRATDRSCASQSTTRIEAWLAPNNDNERSVTA